jgi:hypothetical protein
MKVAKVRWMLALLLAAAVSFTITQSALAGGGKSLGEPSGVVPAQVEHIPGSDLRRVTLTPKAIERIDLRTTTVRQAEVNGSPRTVVPYSSLIYDPHGGTWVYTNPKERTFVRHEVDVDYIEGDDVFLTRGPSVGTTVASVGVAELYGTEFEVGH